MMTLITVICLIFTFTTTGCVAQHSHLDSSRDVPLTKSIDVAMSGKLVSDQTDADRKIDDTMSNSEVHVLRNEIHTLSKRSARYGSVLRLLYRAKHKANRALRQYCRRCRASRYLRARCPDVYHRYMTCEHYARSLALHESGNTLSRLSQSRPMTSVCNNLQNLTLSLVPASEIVYHHDMIIFASDVYGGVGGLRVSIAMFDHLDFIRNVTCQLCGSSLSINDVRNRQSTNIRIRPSDATMVLMSLGRSINSLQNLIDMLRQCV